MSECTCQLKVGEYSRKWCVIHEQDKILRNQTRYLLAVARKALKKIAWNDSTKEQMEKTARQALDVMKEVG